MGNACALDDRVVLVFFVAFGGSRPAHFNVTAGRLCAGPDKLA